MTGRTKTDALLRDIAQLFISYNRRDWEPLLIHLRDGKDISESLTKLIEALLATKEKTRIKKPGQTKVPQRKHPERIPTLREIERGLIDRKFLPDAATLKEVSLRLGSKGQPVKSRTAGIVQLLDHLDKLDNSDFSAAVAAIKFAHEVPPSDLGGEYQRWFNLIYPDRSDDRNLEELHADILEAMDKAIVRGGRNFSLTDAKNFRHLLQRWQRRHGNADASSLVDDFIALAIFGADPSLPTAESDRISGRLLELKSKWRALRLQ